MTKINGYILNNIFLYLENPETKNLHTRAIVSRLWLQVSQNYKCKFCSGKTDLIKKRCISCCNVLEDTHTTKRRKKRLID